MPFALICIGLVLLIAGVNDTQTDLYDLVVGDFTGAKNFLYWIVSIMVLGAIGYVPRLKPISNALLILVVLVLFLSNQGFFAQFTQQLNSTETTTNTNT